LSACMAEPFLVAGTGKADLALMQAAPGRIFVKTGAEGVYCAALPELGLGIALKCDDGAGRGAEVMIAAVLAKLLRGDEAPAAKLSRLAHPP
ncbi:MAG: asparaginase, partial [Mesorhizobium sp.]